MKQKMPFFALLTILYILTSLHTAGAQEYETAITENVFYILNNLKFSGKLKNQSIAVYGFCDAKTDMGCKALTSSLGDKVMNAIHMYKMASGVPFSTVSRRNLEAIETEYMVSTAKGMADTMKLLKPSNLLFTGTWQNSGDQFELNLKVHEVKLQGTETIAFKQVRIDKIRLSRELLSCFETRNDVSPVSNTTGTSDNKKSVNEKVYVNELGMEFVYIEPGTFMMGSPPIEPERRNSENQHQVTLTRGYYLQTTEVTQGQWKAVMGNNPSFYKNCGDDCPVEKVSWHDIQEFIIKLNYMEGTKKYRLPTEAEWEYACRAGTKTPFSFGDCLPTGLANYYGDYPLPGCGKGKGRQKTMSVRSYLPNAWGLYEMHGNVSEWCQDWYGDYPSGSVTDTEGPPSGFGRVHRGGSWLSRARACRSADRDALVPDSDSYTRGFRLSRTP